MREEGGGRRSKREGRRSERGGRTGGGGGGERVREEGGGGRREEEGGVRVEGEWREEGVVLFDLAVLIINRWYSECQLQAWRIYRNNMQQRTSNVGM